MIRDCIQHELGTRSDEPYLASGNRWAAQFENFN
jgi:hypothetical protein